MSHRTRMERHARAAPARPESAGSTGRKQAKAPAGTERATGPPSLHAIQQAYGNQALQRMVQAAVRKEEKPQAAAGLREPYASLSARLEEAAQLAGRSDVQAMYAKLMPGQQMAVLRAMDKIGTDNVDCDRFMSEIQAVQGVRLKEDEVEAEADVSEPGTDAAAGSAADASGLLAPYWEIVRWLSYKAGKQGKAELIRAFNSLSIPQMKVALHRMSGMKEMRMDAFADAMTVTVQLQRWVNWDAVAAAMRAAEQLKDADADADPTAYMEAGKTAEEEEEESEGDSDWDLAGMVAAAGMLGIGMTDDEASDEREPSQSRTGTADAIRARLAVRGQIGWLLLGAATGIDGAEAIGRFVKQRADRAAVVDRFLQLPDSADRKANAGQRVKLLRKMGFANADQCYAQLMRELAAIVFEQGVQGADPGYRKLLDAMGLPYANDQSPTLDRVAEKLAAG